MSLIDPSKFDTRAPASRGDHEDIMLRREDFALGIAEFEREQEAKQAQADVEEGTEFLQGWAHSQGAPSAEDYNFAAAQRDGVDLSGDDPFVPYRYTQPGARQAFGRDLATNRPLVDPTGGYFERFQANKEKLTSEEGASLPPLNAPTRALANGLLLAVSGVGQMAEDYGEGLPAVDWKSSQVKELMGFIGQLKGVKDYQLEGPEAQDELAADIEDIAAELIAFGTGWQAAPFKFARAKPVVKEIGVGMQAAQFLPADFSIGKTLADAGLLPEAMSYLNAAELRENDEVLQARLMMAVEEGVLTGTVAAGIHVILKAARRIRAAEGDTLLEKGFNTIFSGGGTTPRSRQRGSLDVTAFDLREPAGEAAESTAESAGPALPSQQTIEGQKATMEGLVDVVDGLRLKGLDPEDVHAWAADDGLFSTEQIDEALKRVDERRAKAAIDAEGSAAGPQQIERLNQPPSPEAPPAARSAHLLEQEQMRPTGPRPGEIHPAHIPPTATVDDVSEASGAGLLPTDAPVTYQGKDIPDWTPEDWQGFGAQHGVERLGPLTAQVDVGGGVSIPGGLDGEFTFVDMLWLKAQGYNPREWPMELRAGLQRKLSRSTTPAPGDHVETFNRFVFGMLSPNQPLTPNEFEFARMRARSLDEVQQWADLIDWEPGADVPIDARRARTDEIAELFGTQAAAKGGLGLRSSSTLTDVAEFAKLFLKNPDFFTKQADESWHQFTERVMSQARGLSAKVASFSVVWQDPLHASISAVDRHMANRFRDELLADPAERAKFEAKTVKKWNDRLANAGSKREAIEKEIRRVTANRGKKLGPQQRAELLQTLNARLEMTNVEGLTPVENLDEMMAQRTGSTTMAESLMGYITQAPKRKLLTLKGEVSQNIPEHLAQADWVQQPDKVALIGDVYRRALAANDAAAMDQGLHLFSSQWMLWDGLRGRLEPHEVMFPGLYRLPKPSREQAEAAMREHKEAGFFGAAKRASGEVDPLTGGEAKEMVPIRETEKWKKKGGMDWWRSAYFSVLPMLGAGALLEEGEE